MSNDVLNRVWWREDIGGMTKFVAVAIADSAWDDGTAFPAVATLARKCGISRRMVQKATADLCAMGLLRVLHRKDSSNVYQFVLENMPKLDAMRGHKERGLADLFDVNEGAEPRAQGAPPPMHEVHPPRAQGAPPRAQGAPINQSETESETLFTGNIALPAVRERADLENELVEKVTERWNEAAEKHPGIRACRLPLDANRRRAILNRSKQTEQGQDVGEMWAEFFDHIDASPFLQGRVRPSKERTEPFKLALTWALKAANFGKIMEGVYERDSGSGQHSGERADGSRMGPAEQATLSALARRRASRQQSRSGGDSRDY